MVSTFSGAVLEVEPPPSDEPVPDEQPPNVRPPGSPWLALAALLCFGSGLVNLHSVLGGPALPARAALIDKVFPIEFVHVSRFAAMLAGLGLVVLSLNVWRRKKRAYRLGLALALASVAFHLTKGLDYEEALVGTALAAVLWFSRRLFTV